MSLASPIDNSVDSVCFSFVLLEGEEEKVERGGNAYRIKSMLAPMALFSRSI
jgi:hypothetical protein